MQPWDYIRWSNIHRIGISEEKRKNGHKKYLM